MRLALKEVKSHKHIFYPQNVEDFCKNMLKQKHNLKRWQDIYSKSSQKPIETKILERDASKGAIEMHVEDAARKTVQIQSKT